MQPDDPEALAESVRRETEKAVETLRRQRAEIYEVEHSAEDAPAVEPGDTESPDDATPPPELDP